jgi:hypothetical protein
MAKLQTPELPTIVLAQSDERASAIKLNLARPMYSALLC